MPRKTCWSASLLANYRVGKAIRPGFREVLECCCFNIDQAGWGRAVRYRYFLGWGAGRVTPPSQDHVYSALNHAAVYVVMNMRMRLLILIPLDRWWGIRDKECPYCSNPCFYIPYINSAKGSCETRTNVVPSLRSEPIIRRAERSDDLRLALTLAAAFDDDPVARFCVRTDARRHWAMQAGFKRALDLYRPYGLTFVANDGVGVALWARHDEGNSRSGKSARSFRCMCGSAASIASCALFADLT